MDIATQPVTLIPFPSKLGLNCRIQSILLGLRLLVRLLNRNQLASDSLQTLLVMVGRPNRRDLVIQKVVLAIILNDLLFNLGLTLPLFLHTLILIQKPIIQLDEIQSLTWVRYSLLVILN